MGNEITLHIIRFNEHCLEFLRVAQPAFAKIVAPWGHDTMKLAEAKRVSPNTEWICRLYRDEQPLDNPAYNVAYHAELMTPYWDSYSVFESYNEPPPYGIEDWKRINDFEYHFARIVHEKGKKNVAFNWSNGQPPYEAWWHCQDAAREADYIGIHSYGWPFLSTSEGIALRHRAIPRMNKPILLTEFGFTNAVIGGPDAGYYTWGIDPWAAREYKCIQELAWFADRLQEDPYVLAACYFTTGRLPGDAWGTHDWTPKIYRAIAGYKPQTQPKEEEPKMEQPIRVLMPDGKPKVMELEEYLKGVVPREMPSGWPPEALRAQAVAARCYALNAIQYPRHKEKGADVCTTTHCQAWEAKRHIATDIAVESTKGIMATYNSKVINALYSGHCGGSTLNNEDVFGGSPVPYLRGVDCILKGKDPWGREVAGHRVGMCQWGAHDMAAQGATYKEILWHYYTGCEVDGEKAPPGVDHIGEAEKEIDAAKSLVKAADQRLDKAKEHLALLKETL